MYSRLRPIPGIASTEQRQLYEERDRENAARRRRRNSMRLLHGTWNGVNGGRRREQHFRMIEHLQQVGGARQSSGAHEASRVRTGSDRTRPSVPSQVGVQRVPGSFYSRTIRRNFACAAVKKVLLHAMNATDLILVIGG